MRCPIWTTGVRGAVFDAIRKSRSRMDRVVTSRRMQTREATWPPAGMARAGHRLCWQRQTRYSTMHHVFARGSSSRSQPKQGAQQVPRAGKTIRMNTTGESYAVLAMRTSCHSNCSGFTHKQPMITDGVPLPCRDHAALNPRMHARYD